MILKKIVGAGAIAGALSFSALGLAGAANAAPAPQAGPGVVHQAQLAGWGGGRGGGVGGFHGGGGRGFGGRGFGGPGFGGGGWGGPPPPCLLGLCI
jgi:Spy/CpxP family protein refolding chaperone